MKGSPPNVCTLGSCRKATESENITEQFLRQDWVKASVGCGCRNSRFLPILTCVDCYFTYLGTYRPNYLANKTVIGSN